MSLSRAFCASPIATAACPNVGIGTTAARGWVVEGDEVVCEGSSE